MRTLAQTAAVVLCVRGCYEVAGPCLFTGLLVALLPLFLVWTLEAFV